MDFKSVQLQLPGTEIETDPDVEIQLNAPFDTWTTAEVRMKNNNEHRIAFCTRMTRSTDFVVVPSRGFISPHKERWIRVSRKPNVKPRNQDRIIIIYSMILSDEYTVNVNWFSDGSVVRKKNITLKQ
ncbi:unnamed protein product [Soboliphyme baturini]|uniref:Major sperm protein n=1 Tax=Soboliphyme baturini TaxID=241478 RepID=A0A183ILV9_9BILA|nr:unnamed protein product [Soboliphyme baturini]